MNSLDPLVRQLQDRRHTYGLKPYVLAELAGVSPQIVYATEAGVRSPRLSSIRAWSEALDCDIALIPRTISERKAL